MIYNNAFVSNVNALRCGAGGRPRAATRWCCKRRIGRFSPSVETVKMFLLYLLCCACADDQAACNLMWGWLFDKGRIVTDFICNFSGIFLFICKGLLWKKKKQQPDCLVFDEQRQQQRLQPLRGKDTPSSDSETGLEWRPWTMHEGGCQVLRSEILPPNPPPLAASSFLPCTVVYTWATVEHICQAKRGRTMKQ